jgi:hypothetical protein
MQAAQSRTNTDLGRFSAPLWPQHLKPLLSRGGFLMGGICGRTPMRQSFSSLPILLEMTFFGAAEVLKL